MTEKKKNTKRKVKTTQSNKSYEQPETPAPEPVVLPEIIPGNPNRKALILYANITNSAVVWIGGEENSGIPMLPNDKLTLEVTEDTSVIGAAGNWLHVAELITEGVA